MEQRRLRLGDILDDYCPRERRVTNHAVVAMIEENVKQTRCTTCDSEHVYKGARVPKRRNKETPAALYKEVLAGMPEADAAPALAAAAPMLAAPVAMPPVLDIPTRISHVDVVSAPEPVLVNSEVEEVHPPMHSDNDQRDDVDEPQSRVEDTADNAERADEVPTVEGPVHRALIRATLPRPEGQKDPRPLPDFTVRQAPPRGNGGHGNGHGGGHGGFRPERMRMRATNGHSNGQGNGQREVNGNRAPSSGSRFGSRPSGGGRPPMGRSGSPSGFRSGNGGPNGKRGRGPRG